MPTTVASQAHIGYAVSDRLSFLRMTGHLSSQYRREFSHEWVGCANGSATLSRRLRRHHKIFDNENSTNGPVPPIQSSPPLFAAATSSIKRFVTPPVRPNPAAFFYKKPMQSPSHSSFVRSTSHRQCNPIAALIQSCILSTSTSAIKEFEFLEACSEDLTDVSKRKIESSARG